MISTGSADGPFSRPQEYRDNILRSFLAAPHQWPGRSYVVVFPTKFCPVGCSHCYFASPKPGKSPAAPDTALSEQDVQVVLRFLAEADTELLQITGGGEPLLESARVLQLIEGSPSSRIDLNTSGAPLSSPSKAQDLIERMFAAVRARRCGGTVYFRLSVDEFHVQRIGTRAIDTVLGVFRRNYHRYARERFFLRFHTLFEDQTVPRLIARFGPEIGKVECAPLWRYHVPTRLHFIGDVDFEVTYGVRMLSDAEPRMTDHERVARAVDWFAVIRQPKPGLFLDSEGRPGLCLIIHEDGSVELWNTTPTDTVQNIRTHRFHEVRRSIMTDVIQVAAMEKTLLHVDSILEEVNPLALRRARAIGSADSYSRRSLVEARDRLYVSLRLLQGYIAEGMGSRIDMQSLDPVVRDALQLSPAELRHLHFQSRHDIVEEHLRDSNVTARQLARLYRSVELGHYTVEPGEMRERVRVSSRLTQAVKAEFLELARAASAPPELQGIPTSAGPDAC